MPKERFILYPDAGREGDPTLLLGWAGWDHAQQALALNRIVDERLAEDASAERLVPLVAGLAAAWSVAGPMGAGRPAPVTPATAGAVRRRSAPVTPGKTVSSEPLPVTVSGHAIVGVST